MTLPESAQPVALAEFAVVCSRPPSGTPILATGGERPLGSGVP